MAQPHGMLVVVVHIPKVPGEIAASTVSALCHTMGVLQLNLVPVQ